MNTGIYKILNLITGKFYIGSAVNFKARWTQHKGKLNSNIHPNKFLQASWNLHGEEAFEFIILEYCEKINLPELEQCWMDATSCCDKNIGYNLYPIAGSPLGSKWTEERKLIASQRMQSFRHTEEAKAKMSEGKQNQSKEIGAKISAAKMGHFVSEETKAKIGAANRGRKRTEETKLKTKKLDKWPHGFVCICRECKDRKNEYSRNWRKSNKEAQNVQA